MPAGETGTGDRTAVGDADGQVHGTFSERDQTDRRARIAQRVVDEHLLGQPDESDAETRKNIFDALAVLDPVEVRDGGGNLTGYLTTRFVSVDDYPAARAEAQEQLDRSSLAP